jgi:hypothetical protein
MSRRRTAMQLQITRLPTDERTYSIDTGSETRSVVRDFELKEWLYELGIGDSTVAAVLDMEPNVTMVLQVADKAA